MIRWKTLADMPTSIEWAKENGYEAFKNAMKRIIDSGQIGFMEGGKIVTPTELDIKNYYNKLLNIKEEAIIEPIKKIKDNG
jgi:hypothetical protein